MAEHKGEVNWLRLEDRVRRALIRYARGESADHEALREIDDAVGDETGRGYELEESD